MTLPDRRPSFVLSRFSMFSLYRYLALPLAVAGCISNAPTTYQPRPYHFDSPAPVVQETQRLAQRMSAQHNLRPTFVDPSTGTILGAWSGPQSFSTFSSSEGGRAGWRVHRYRAFVRPNGWASSVFVDLEEVECDDRGFRWTESQVFGSCRAVTTMTADQLRALDATAASLRG
jgi:hypothetical protein